MSDADVYPVTRMQQQTLVRLLSYINLLLCIISIHTRMLWYIPYKQWMLTRIRNPN